MRAGQERTIILRKEIFLRLCGGPGEMALLQVATERPLTDAKYLCNVQLTRALAPVFPEGMVYARIHLWELF